MDSDIRSQITRAKELLEELKQSVNSDLLKKEVSDKTRNLTQEILVKMKHVFDQSMRQFFEKQIAFTLTQSEKDKAKVYFPMVTKQTDLQSVLGRAMIKDLEKNHPNVYKFIASVQPYNKNYDWIKHFSEFANEKHIRLTPQKRNETKSVFIGKGGTGIRMTGNASIRMGGNTSIGIGGSKIYGGQEISPNSDFIIADPNIDVKKETWVSFTLADSNINAVALCDAVIAKGEKLLASFFQLF